jgi:hypothetical protein
LALWFSQLGVSPLVSYLLAAVVGTVLSAALAIAGMNRLKSDTLTPIVTIRQMERDLTAAKEFAK